MTGAEFRTWRKSLKLSLNQAAKALGCSRQHISYMEKQKELRKVYALATELLTMKAGPEQPPSDS